MGRNYLLDGMRGMAALAVVAYHLGSLLQIKTVPNGYLAVDFFFCLSGFVIAKAFGDRLTAREFMLARSIRLYPVFLLGFALGAVKTAAMGHFSVEGAMAAPDFARAFVLNIVALPDIGPRLYPFNGPSWSLFLEMALCAAYVLFLRRLRGRELVAVALIGALGMVWGSVEHGSLNLGWNAETLPFGLARATFGFSVGMLIARRPTSAKVVAPPWLLAPLALGLVASGNDLLFALVLSPLIVAVGASMDVGEKLRPLFRWAGEVSYPLYAVHWPIVAGVVFVGARLGLGPVAVLAGGLAVSIGAAHLVARLYERPLRHLLTTLADPRRSRAG